MVHLRTRIAVVAIPAAILVILVTATLSFMVAETAVTDLAASMLTQRARQIRNFALNQWQTLDGLGLQDDILYRRTAAAAIQSYATGVIDPDSQLVLALQGDSRIPLATRNLSLSDADREALHGAAGAGWVDLSLNGGRYVGQSFAVPPFGWSVFVLAERDRHFQVLERMIRQTVAIAVGTVIVALLIVVLGTGFITRPLEQMTARLALLAESPARRPMSDISRQDEIGALARQIDQTNEALVDALNATHERETETIQLLALATEYRDFETGRHMVRVGHMARLLAELAGEDADRTDLIHRAAPLHDVGKIGIPDELILRPGRLSRDEFERVKQHTLIGYSILRKARSRYLLAGAEIALSHHERWDGAGYPSGLERTQIPRSGRIVALVDVLDALTSPRPYKEAWSFERAVAEIRAGRGTHFDPELTDLMVAHIDEFRRILERYADPGESSDPLHQQF